MQMQRRERHEKFRRRPPDSDANNCGHPAKLRGPSLVAHPPMLAGGAPNYNELLAVEWDTFGLQGKAFVDQFLCTSSDNLKGRITSISKFYLTAEVGLGFNI